METTTSEKPKKGMSGFSTFEFAISLMILVSLVSPIATGNFMGIGETKMVFYFEFLSKSPLFYFAFVLPVVNIIIKNYKRSSWLSLLTLYAAYMPIMLVDTMGEDAWIQVKPSFGYYLAWVNIILMTGSVLISWLISLGMKCTNYKRLFIISGIMIVGGPVIGYILIKLLDAITLGAIILPLSFLGVPILILAIISFFINHKKISESNEGAEAEVSNASKPCLNKKVGVIAGGVLVLVLISLVVHLLSDEQTEESDYPQKYIVVQSDAMLYSDYDSKKYLTRGKDAFLLQKGSVAEIIESNEVNNTNTVLYKIRFKDITENYEENLYIEFAKAVACLAFPIPEDYLYKRLDWNYQEIESGNLDAERINIIGRITKGKYKNTWLMLENIDSEFDKITFLYIGHKEGEVIVFDRWVQADRLWFDKYEDSSKILVENDGEYTRITLTLKETDDFNDWSKSEIEELMMYSEEIHEKQMIKCLGYLGHELKHWYPEVTYDRR